MYDLSLVFQFFKRLNESKKYSRPLQAGTRPQKLSTPNYSMYIIFLLFFAGNEENNFKQEI